MMNLYGGTEAVAALQRGFEMAVASDPLHAAEEGAAEERRAEKAAGAIRNFHTAF